MTTSGPRHSLVRGAWSGSAPLWLWAAHFAACYVAAAAGCIQAAGAARAAAGVAGFIGAATAIALLMGLWLLVRACRGLRAGPGDLLPRLRLFVAALAFIGIAWTGVPLAFIAPCG